MINTSKLIGSEILKIWQKTEYATFCCNDPVMPQEINPKSSLLFIGLNPSKRKKDPLCKHGEIYTYTFPKANDPYFGKFYKIAEQSGFKDQWSHFDLLYFKGMQVDTSDIKKNEEKKGHIFIWEQLQQSKRLLESLEPKMIVVSNRLAGEFMGRYKKEYKGRIVNEWMNLELIKKDDYHLWNGIPVIFSVQFNRFCKNETIEELIEQIKRIKIVCGI